MQPSLAPLEDAMRRRICIALATVFASGLSACQPTPTTPPSKGSTMNADKKEVVHFDVMLVSYLERPIFDVYLNGQDIGVFGVLGDGPYHGGGALMTGVAVPLGPQVVTWRLGGPEGMPGNGDTVKSANQPVLQRPDPKLTYLGVHIYPDNTVELVPEPYWPEKTARGEEINRQWEKKHGQ